MGKLFELLFTFMKIGALSFGGGYAMIPFLQQESVGREWLTVSEFTDIVAISQITPGPVAVNMATFVGYTQASVLGSLFATLGVCIPSFVIITTLVKFFVKFAEKQIIKNIFFGLRPAVTGLIFSSAFLIAFLEFFPNSESLSLDLTIINYKSIIIFVGMFICMYKFKLNPIIAILISAIIGIILF